MAQSNQELYEILVTTTGVAEVQKLVAAMELANKNARLAGAGIDQGLTPAVDRLAVATSRANKSALDMTTRFGDTKTSARNAALAITNVGFQVQDFAVQVSGGTSAMRAFAQQAPQILTAFSIGSPQIAIVVAIIASLIAILPAAIKWLGVFKDVNEEAAKSTKAVADALTGLNTYIQSARTLYDEYVAAVKSGSPDVIRALEDEARIRALLGQQQLLDLAVLQQKQQAALVDQQKAVVAAQKEVAAAKAFADQMKNASDIDRASPIRDLAAAEAALAAAQDALARSQLDADLTTAQITAQNDALDATAKLLADIENGTTKVATQTAVAKDKAVAAAAAAKAWADWIKTLTTQLQGAAAAATGISQTVTGSMTGGFNTVVGLATQLNTTLGVIFDKMDAHIYKIRNAYGLYARTRMDSDAAAAEATASEAALNTAKLKNAYGLYGRTRIDSDAAAAAAINAVDTAAAKAAGAGGGVAKLTKAEEEALKAAEEAAAAAVKAITDVTDIVKSNLEENFDALIDHTKSVQDAFKDMLVGMLADLAKFLVSRQIQSLVNLLGTSFGSSFTGFTNTPIAPAPSAASQAASQSRQIASIYSQAYGEAYGESGRGRGGRAAGRASGRDSASQTSSGSGGSGQFSSSGPAVNTASLRDREKMVVNINNTVSDEVKVTATQNNQGMGAQLDILIERKVKQLFGSGKLDQSMQRNFGARRVPG